MNVQFDLSAFGLEELHDAELMTVSGGLGGWLDLLRDAGRAVFICVASNPDSIIDGLKAGWAAAAE